MVLITLNYIFYIFMHIYIYAYLYLCIFIFMHIYVYAYLYSCIFIFMHINIYAYLYLCILIYMHIYIYAFMHIYICKSQHGYKAFTDIILSYIGALNFAAKIQGLNKVLILKMLKKIVNVENYWICQIQYFIEGLHFRLKSL